MTQTARAATVGELALLRTAGDWSRAFLGIYKPNVIYTALLNGTPTTTDMIGDLPFDGGTGTLSNVKAEMTLWVGSTAGARDLGVCRIRKAPIAGTIYVGFTSEIAWVDNCYLTIVDHAMLWRKPVLMDAGVVVMDGEYAFSDQHIDFDPVPLMTPHAVATLTGATVDVEFDAGDSWVFDSTISGYAWSAPGASATSGTTTATPTITYNAAGYYRVYCTVTAANGKTSTGVRFVMVFDATNKPYSVEVQNPSVDYDEGGWKFAVRMFADADPTNVIEGALAILFAEDHYGSTEQSIGQVANRENIICWGYIAGESISWDAEISSVEFEVQGPQYFLKKIESTPLALTCANSTPDAWSVMPALTPDRALWHILHWRSNASAIINISLTGDARYASKLEAVEGSLWNQMNEIAWNKIFGRLGCDRYGSFFAVIDPQCVAEADRTWATVMTITKKDWSETVDITRITQRSISLLSTSSWMCESTGNTTTLYSLAVGHVGAHYGSPQIIDKLLAGSQAQSNEMAGLYMGWKNNELEFEFQLAQNNRMVDLWPNQFLDVSLAAGDTPRGIAYAGNLVPRSITLRIDAESGCWDTNIICEAETFAELAVNGDVPGLEGLDLSFPPMPPFPPLPDIDPVEWPPTEENPNHPTVVVFASSNYGVGYTTNFNEDYPYWNFMNSGLNPAVDFADIYNFVVTPSGAMYLHCRIGNVVFRAAGLGAAWVQVAGAADFIDDYGVQLTIIGIGVNPLDDDQIAIASGGTFHPGRFPNEYDEGRFRLMTNGAFTTAGDDVIRAAPYGGDVLYANGKWYLLSCEQFAGAYQGWQFDAEGVVIGAYSIGYITGQSACRAWGRVAGTQGLLYSWDASAAANGFDKQEDGTPPTVTHFITPTYKRPSVLNGMTMAVSPTGQRLLLCDGSGVSWKSSDGGTTWVAGIPHTAFYSIDNCRDENRWIFAAGTGVYLSMDFATTNVLNTTIFDKKGNLPYMTPLLDITHIRYIE